MSNTYNSRLIGIFDGDTVKVLIDLGFCTYQEHSIRLLDVNAPEINQGSMEMRKKATIAKEYVRKWFEDHGRMNCGENNSWPFIVETSKGENFGRYLGVIRCLKNHCLNDMIIQDGIAELFVSKKGYL